LPIFHSLWTKIKITSDKIGLRNLQGKTESIQATFNTMCLHLLRHSPSHIKALWIHSLCRLKIGWTLVAFTMMQSIYQAMKTIKWILIGRISPYPKCRIFCNHNLFLEMLNTHNFLSKICDLASFSNLDRIKDIQIWD
jgi:hypothetical protein